MEGPLMQQVADSAPYLAIGTVIVNALSKNQGKRRFLHALAAVCVIAAVKTAYNNASMSPNYYSILRVRRHSDPALFRVAFKERSLQLHPDKNPAPDAQEQFNQLKAAFDVLNDPKRRDLYNFFGERSLKSDPRADRLQLGIDMALSYMVWLVSAIFVTMSLPTGNARLWACAAVAMSLMVEAAVVLYDQPLPTWWSFSLTEHEVVLWLRNVLLPSALLACRALGLHLHVSNHDAVVVLSHAVQQHQKATRGLLHQLHTQLQLLHRGDSDVSAETVEQKIAELERELAGSDKALAVLHSVLRTQQREGSSLVYWLVLVVFYVGFCQFAR